MQFLQIQNLIGIFYPEMVIIQISEFIRDLILIV